MVCLQDLAAGAPADHSFFPFSWHFANPRWWDDLGIAPFHPTIPPQVHVPDVTHPTFYSTTSLQWYRGASCAPPFISSEPPVRTEPLPDPPHGVMGSPNPAPDRVGPSQPPLNFVDGNGYIVVRGLVEARDCEVFRLRTAAREILKFLFLGVWQKELSFLSTLSFPIERSHVLTCLSSADKH